MSNLKSVGLTILEPLAFNAPKFRGHAWPRPLFETFSGVMSGLSLETSTSNLKSVALTVLELLALNSQKFRDHVTVATPISGAGQKYFLRLVKGSYVSNLVKIGPKLGSQSYP